MKTWLRERSSRAEEREFVKSTVKKFHDHLHGDENLITRAFFFLEEKDFEEAQEEANKMEHKDLQIVGINSDKGFKVTPKELEDCKTQFDEDFFKDLMSVFKKILILLYYGERIVNSPKFNEHSWEYFIFNDIMERILCQINEDNFQLDFSNFSVYDPKHEKNCRDEINLNKHITEGIVGINMEEIMFRSIVCFILLILPIEVGEIRLKGL